MTSKNSLSTKDGSTSISRGLQHSNKKIDKPAETTTNKPPIIARRDNWLAVWRSVWGFLFFIPFCVLWGVNNFTLFSLIGTLYFIPVHWLFDLLFSKDIRPIECRIGLHKWTMIPNPKPYDTFRKCVYCNKKQELGFDGLCFTWGDM